MQKKIRRGRPVTFKLAERKGLAKLIRCHGARGAWLASARPVSVDTLLKIAREFGIKLNKGRRPRKAA